MAGAEARGDTHPWEKTYPSNVDWHAPIATKPLFHLIDDAVATYGDRPAIDFMDRVTSYRELGALVNRAAEGFQKLGVGKGRKVGLLLPNCPAFVVCYFGILKAGGTVVNVNPLYAVEEIKSQVEDAEADILVTLDLAVLYDKARIALDQSRLTHLVVCPLAQQLPKVKGLLFPLVKGRELAKITRDSRHVFFKELLATAGKPKPVEIDVENDVAVLQYTGGTTGTSKGAMLTHANLYANTVQSVMMFPDAERGSEIMVGVLPLFHVFAMTVVMNFSLHIGAKMILLPRFELDTVLKTIDKKRPTFFPAVPTIYIAISGHPDIAAKKYDLSSIKLCLSGGAALPREVQETFQKLSGCTLVEGYGLSETSPVAVCNPTHKGGSRDGSLGLPLPGTVIEITSPDAPTSVLPQGETGEICISGPQVMKGYWNREEETETAFAGGRFHSGDVGYIDEDGYVFLIDRLKEVIIAGGYNVYPRHVEEAIYKHPAVLEVTVIGVDDQYRQQTVKAFVRLKEGESLTQGDLKGFLKDKLSPIEMPKTIEFRAELPKTLIGKLSKKELIAEEAAKQSEGAGVPA
jgi:long-chain acyl-CoA synthetase